MAPALEGAAGLALISGFVHPGLALGALLFVVPLLIHLLNRQRHRPMPWAAMRFVLAAYRKTRRRVQLENLLLLLLRMAAVALLALAVARPFAGGESPLAGLTESRRDVVLVLDGSASTGWRGTTRTVFEDIVDRAREHLAELDAGRGDRVRLILAGDHPRLLSWRSPEEAFGLLSTLTSPTDERLDLPAALGEVMRFAEEDARASGECTLEIRLLCDLSRQSFELGGGEEPAPGEEAVTEILDRLAELGGRILVEDLGPGELVPANRSVASIELDGPVIGPDMPVETVVTVENHGPQALGGQRLALLLDGQRLPSRLVDLPARGEARVSFNVVFPRDGAHVLEARLDSDGLVVDDARTTVVEVPPPVRVLLVNGDPAFEVEKDETGLFGLVLEPPTGDAAGGPGSLPAPFTVRTLEPGRLRSNEADVSDFDLIVLANVSSLDQGTLERIAERVAGGASLLFTVGDNTAATYETWNARAFAPDGSKLLPAELGGEVAVVDRRRDWWRVQDFQGDHPALAFFSDERWKPLLTEVPIYAFQTARVLEDARVLARLDDDEASPLFIERAYDRGKVFLWLTTIDPDWARVAESPRTLVPLVHELVRYAGTPPVPPRNVGVGALLAAELDGYPRSPTVVRPDGARRPLTGESVEVAPGVWRLPAVETTDRAGLYRIEAEGGRSVPFAVQLDPRESDLARLDPAGFAAQHPAMVLVSSGLGGSSDEPEDITNQGELWRALALACLLALVLESLWAAWIGRRRTA